MRYIIFILLASPVFAQCEDSLLHSRDSVIRIQEKQIVSLFEINKSEFRRYDDLFARKIESDSLHNETILQQRFQISEMEIQKPLSLALGILTGVILALTTILLIR